MLLSTLPASPTPYAEINVLLLTLLTEVRGILGDGFLGMYLSGSLAMGDFDDSSDVDVLVVTTDTLPQGAFPVLAAMHERLTVEYPRWGRELEASYMPRAAVRRHDPGNVLHPHISRGESLQMTPHGRDWSVQRYIVREHGIVIAGPTPRDLIAPVSSDELRAGTLELLRGWWAEEMEHLPRLHPRGYRSYLVLTACRLLYTLEYGAVVSKPTAARWAREALGAPWASLIEWAQEARHNPGTGELDNLHEAQDFMLYTLERARQIEATSGAATPEQQPQ